MARINNSDAISPAAPAFANMSRIILNKSQIHVVRPIYGNTTATPGIDWNSRTVDARRSPVVASNTINDAVVDLILRCTYAQRQIAVCAFAPRKKKVLYFADGDERERGREREKDERAVALS